MRSRFAGEKGGTDAGDQSLVWGVATLEWGNDVAQPTAPAQPRL